jgi:hypothetical protein
MSCSNPLHVQLRQHHCMARGEALQLQPIQTRVAEAWTADHLLLVPRW